MPPVESIAQIRATIETKLMPAVPAKWIHQVRFGLRAYALTPFRSAASNARGVVANPHTAATKSDRLLANSKLASYLGTVFDSLGLVTRDSLINVDHSDMNGLMVLAGATQTYDGRALPCMLEATYSDRLPAGKDAPKRKQCLRAARAEERKNLKLTAHTVASLTRLATRLGFWPKFVFDRGFCNETIVTALVQAKATFYVRAKSGRVIEFDGQKTTLAQLAERDSTIELFGLKLRVIRSVEDGKNDEPWYILTNDFGSTPEQVITIYYHRFEIEEAFRDIKQIFGLARTRLNKPNSLQIILWLVAIGLALLYLAEDAKQKQARRLAHPKKQLSFTLYMVEQLARLQSQLLWQTPLAWLTTEGML
jgi:hypothetical protein